VGLAIHSALHRKGAGYLVRAMLLADGMRSRRKSANAAVQIIPIK
jgi:hypothetical protein